LKVGRHVLERKHRDRRLVEKGKARHRFFLRRRLDRRRGFRLGGEPDLQRINSHRLDDVLELGLTEIT
jgi:hypothetical protein